MKVTFCTFDAVDAINGVNVWLLRIIPALQALGIEVRVLFITWHPPHLCTTLPRMHSLGIRCEAVQTPYYTERHVRGILEMLAADPPDIFVPNQLVAAMYASKWVRQAGIPTIGVLHSDDEQTQAVQNEFVFGDNDFQLSSIVCVSKKLEQDVLARKPKQTLVYRIPCVADPPTGSARPPCDKFRIVYEGRLDDNVKHISCVAKAFCRAARELPNVEAYIYGSGPDQAKVEKILAEHGADLPVHFKGRIPSEEIHSELLKSHCITLLSDNEGLPVSLLEAMACGVVPVCLEIAGGVSELIEDGVTGLLVHDRGDDYLAAIRKLHNNSALWEKLSEAAKVKFNREYTLEHAVSSWLELFNKLTETDVERSKIQVPARIKLPKVVAELAAADSREPPVWRKALRKLLG
ncbi:glycosyltransferase family 4 protein [Oligoflexia bacterium]|nr:glycosyltransferase family 4 protein [Oligoflexia bacterium]